MRWARLKARGSSILPQAAAPKTFSWESSMGCRWWLRWTKKAYFVDGFDWLTGMHVSEIAEPIFEDLKAKKACSTGCANYTHRYPTCWRCKTELVFRLVDEWFISMGEVYDKPRDRADRRRKSAQPALPDHGRGRPDPTGSPILAMPARWTGCATCMIG